MLFAIKYLPIHTRVKFGVERAGADIVWASKIPYWNTKPYDRNNWNGYKIDFRIFNCYDLEFNDQSTSYYDYYGRLVL